MPTAPRSTRLLPVSPDPAARASLSRQLTDALRRAVLHGQYAPGSRLPSTRALAAELDVSRNTVLEAYGQLLAEGYLEGRTGSGTFVSHALPDALLRERLRAVSPAR